MKRIFLMATAAVLALAMSSCSKEDQTEINASITSMTLSASVDQQSDTKATIGGTSNWKFSFETGDKVKVTNSEVLSSSTYYTFTKGETDFTSSDAKATSASADWYAFFPGTSITLTSQTGTKDNAADHFGYAGKQTGVAAGTTNLSMTLSPQMAVLEIVNWSGAISISAKTGDNYVTGMIATTGDTPSFTVETSTKKSTLLAADNYGIYYIAVPAGVALSFYNNDDVITGKTGTSFTLVAGKHYKLTIGTAPTGFEPVEYLESTGANQYIVTGLTFTNGNKFDFKVQWQDEVEANYDALFGANSGVCEVLLGYQNMSTNYLGGSFTYVWYTGTDYVICLDLAKTTSKLSLTVDGGSVRETSGNPNSLNVYLFGVIGLAGQESIDQYHKERFYWFKCENKTSTVLNLIPAICKKGYKYTDGNTGSEIETALSADKPGMYDTVSGHFFVNQSTGDDFSYPTK